MRSSTPAALSGSRPAVGSSRNPLHHAAAQFRGVLRADLPRKPGHGEPKRCQFVDQRVIEIGVLAERQANVLGHRQRPKEPAVLEHHSEAQAKRIGCLIAEPVQVYAEHPDRAGIRLVQQDHLAKQCRFSRAAAPDEREDLSAADLKVEARVHHMRAEVRR